MFPPLEVKGEVRDGFRKRRNYRRGSVTIRIARGSWGPERVM
jgi:hypothetical protein